jgi:glutaminase
MALPMTPRLLALLALLLCIADVSADSTSHADTIRNVLDEVYREVLPDRSGQLPDYIPALTSINPERMAISVVLPDGQTISVGDAETPFTIMSAAKPFTAALVIRQSGRQAIVDKIGVEPTGEPFNSIVAIEEHPDRSINPLVNAGAMAAVSLLEGDSANARWHSLLGWYRQLANAELPMNRSVYESVRDTGLRNQAIAALLRDYDRLYDDPEEVRDVYNRQSSVEVTTEQLAMMGATLANGGVQPVTGQRLLAETDVAALLAVMTMAGMYEDSGHWAWHVGLPAKSGVGGGIIAVAPGRMSIAAWSPRLDEAGNSVRAQAAIRQISARLGLGLFGPVESSP